MATPPDDSMLVALRDADHARISHRHLATIYPPLAQGVFALAAFVHPGPVVLKIFFSLFNLGTVLFATGGLFCLATLFFGTKGGYYDSDDYDGNGTAH
jgi:hypothetical protein